MQLRLSKVFCSVLIKCVQSCIYCAVFCRHSLSRCFVCVDFSVFVVSEQTDPAQKSLSLPFPSVQRIEPEQSKSLLQRLVYRCVRYVLNNYLCVWFLLLISLLVGTRILERVWNKFIEILSELKIARI